MIALRPWRFTLADPPLQPTHMPKWNKRTATAGPQTSPGPKGQGRPRLPTKYQLQIPTYQVDTVEGVQGVAAKKGTPTTNMYGRNGFDLSVSTPPPAPSEGPGPLFGKQKQRDFVAETPRNRRISMHSGHPSNSTTNPDRPIDRPDRPGPSTTRPAHRPIGPPLSHPPWP